MEKSIAEYKNIKSSYLIFSNLPKNAEGRYCITASKYRNNTCRNLQTSLLFVAKNQTDNKDSRLRR